MRLRCGLRQLAIIFKLNRRWVIAKAMNTVKLAHRPAATLNHGLGYSGMPMAHWDSTTPLGGVAINGASPIVALFLLVITGLTSPTTVHSADHYRLPSGRRAVLVNEPEPLGARQERRTLHRHCRPTGFK